MKTLNELSKQTLGSYVKKAATDARINSMIGKDFDYKAKTSRKPSMKDASTELSSLYKKKAWKRSDNITKAVDRLMKEQTVVAWHTPEQAKHIADLDQKFKQHHKDWMAAGGHLKTPTDKAAADKHEKAKEGVRNEIFKKQQEYKAAAVARGHFDNQPEYYPKDSRNRYVGDSVEYPEGSNVNEVKSSAAVRLQKVLQKTKEDRERRERLAQPFVDKVFGKKDQKQSVAEAKDPQEYDYEGDMAKSQLRSIIANSQAIHDMLEDTTNMAEWVQSKITLSADYISTVRDYMTSETNEENHMDKIHPDALHVKPATVNGQTKYKVHAVGKNFSDGIKVGEHLSDTELDDFSEMGGKVKHMKEERTLKDIIDEARGRPRKNPIAAPTKKSDDDEGEDYGPDSGPEADQHIQNQLKRAHDARDVEGGMKGGADVKFENGKKHFIKSEHAHKVLTALEKLKPADRAEAASHVYKSHENFQAVHSMLK